MSTTRHPGYTADALISSTEAARILRSNPHDPLAFRRLEQLRASGKLRPVLTDTDCWFRESDVLRAAHPWEQPEPERGAWKPVAVAAAFGATAWAAIVGLIWAITR